MPLYKLKAKSIYQIHIPRTGGRYVRDLLKRNKFKVTGWDFTEKHKEAGIEIPHLHYDLFRRLQLPEDTHYFSVIRNPIERFKACASHTSYFADYYRTNYYKNPNLWLSELTSYDVFKEKIEERNTFLKINAFYPQYKFLHPDTKLWKMENGFGSDFINWFNKNFDTEIEEKDVMQMWAPPLTIGKTMEDSFDNKIHLELSSEVKSFIENYYQDDFNIWYNIDKQ